MNYPSYDIYLEIGSKKVFAGALDWPGWCRNAKDESGSLQALLSYASRYTLAIAPAGLRFTPPVDVTSFTIVERLTGNFTTDYGSPDIPPAGDALPMGAEELSRSVAILKASWQTLDEIADSALGKVLRKGPRGGGRELDEIRKHVLRAEAAYINRLGWRFRVDAAADFETAQRHTRETALQALQAAVKGELHTRGPRGGAYWTPRYFVRRTAWHALDHAWEIEDRIS